jgi:predicted metal-dependent hydrolase
MNERIHTGGFDIELRRSSKRRSYGLTVDRAGAVVAHAPESAPSDEIRDWIRSRLLWLHQKQMAKQALQPISGSLEFVTGESIFYLGKSRRIKRHAESSKGVQFDGNHFLLGVDEEHPTSAFRRWFIQQGRSWFPERVDWFQNRISCKPGVIRVCDLGFRWGSCSTKGNLNFNWRLLQLPLRLIDYVVAHEMAHLMVPNHDPAFWKVLKEIQPDCMERRDELDHQARRYLRFG